MSFFQVGRVHPGCGVVRFSDGSEEVVAAGGAADADAKGTMEVYSVKSEIEICCQKCNCATINFSFGVQSGEKHLQHFFVFWCSAFAYTNPFGSLDASLRLGGGVGEVGSKVGKGGTGIQTRDLLHASQES